MVLLKAVIFNYSVFQPGWLKNIRRGKTFNFKNEIYIIKTVKLFLI